MNKKISNENPRQRESDPQPSGVLTLSSGGILPPTLLMLVKIQWPASVAGKAFFFIKWTKTIRIHVNRVVETGFVVGLEILFLEDRRSAALERS